MANGDYALSPDQVPPYNPAEAARAEAASYLASQGVPGYSPVPPPGMSAAPPIPDPAGPPPPPQPPGKPSGAMSGALHGLKNAATVGLGALVGGPIGAGIANNIVTAQDVAKGPQPPPDAPPPSGPMGPPPPPASTEDAPLILNQPGGGGMRQVSPAGMYPHSLTTQAHMGRPVPEGAKSAFETSAAMQLQAADKQASADADYYNQVRNAQALRMKAADDAATRHAAVQANRDAIVKQRLGEIEQLNTQASAAIDPEKFWNDRGAAAKVIGGIAIGLGGFGDRLLGRENGALKIIESGINREIQAQLANRQQAGQAVARKERLLDLHLARLGDEDKAVDATKLALYDNVLGQMDQYAAENKSRVSQAALLNTKAGILEKRGELLNKMGIQETDDVNRAYTEQYRPAQYAGGGGTPAGKMDGYELIPVPASDRTAEKNAMIAVPKGSHEALSKIVGATNTLVGINQEALERIQSIKKDIGPAKSGDVEAIKRIQANRKLLEDLGQRKASYLSSSEGQGVLKESEFDRAMTDRVMFTDWWKPGVDVEKRIQGQNNSLTGAAGRMVQGAGGQRVRMAYTRDKNGALQPTPLFTGQVYTPGAVGPEMAPVQEPGK
jgi:hypothetical protein